MSRCIQELNVRVVYSLLRALMFEFRQRWRIVVDKDMSKCGYIFPLRICENVGVVCQGVRK